MNRFWDELEQARRRWDVLRHPFYLRWSEGTLERDELARYAVQYESLVEAIALASERVGARGQELAGHAREEREHVALWRDFVTAIGGEQRAAEPETRGCAASWAGADGRVAALDLVSLYAIESAQPAIAQTKLDGLHRHYGLTQGTEYFELHSTLDGDHARLARRELAPLLAGADEQELLDRAGTVHRDYWRFLDGVERVTAELAAAR